MNLKQEKETILLFSILDYNENENMFNNVKILNNKDILDKFQVESQSFQKVLTLKDDNKKQKQKIIIKFSNNNNELNIEFEVEIIKGQINFIYPMINNINDNSIDFRYKNFTKKKSINFVEIKLNEKKSFKVFYNFIDKEEKIGRCILLNVSNIYSIKYKEEYLVNDEPSHYWIYLVKQYENIIDFTQTKNLISNNGDLLKEIYNSYQKIKNYKESISILLNENENIILKFIKLGKKKEYFDRELLKKIHYPIDEIDNYTTKDFENLYHFLYVNLTLVYHDRYEKKISKLDSEDKTGKKAKDEIKNAIIKFFKELKDSLKNIEESFKKLNEQNNITLKEKGKMLAVIEAVLEENSNYNIDKLKFINLKNIDTKNIKYNCYIKALNLFKDIINNLSYDSLLTECGLELNSRYLKSYNSKNKEESSIEISIITLEELKEHLIKCIPERIYRVNHTSDNYSFYNKISRDIIMNEKYIFNNLDEKEIESILNSKDKDGIYTLSILILYFHELYGHSKVRIIEPKKKTPLKFNYKGYLICLFNDNNKKYKEAGRIVEKYITNFNELNQKFLLNHDNYNVNELLNYKLYINSNFDELNGIINKIRGEENEKETKKITNFNEYLERYQQNEKENLFSSELPEDELLNNYITFLPEKLSESNDEDCLNIKNYFIK